MTMPIHHPHFHRRQVAVASGLDILAGIWLLISPWVLAFTLAHPTMNNLIFGIIIGVLAAIRFFGAYDMPVLSWINVILGIWVAISPWILGFGSDTVPMTCNLATGIAIIILAGWSALASGPESVGEPPMMQ